MMTFSVLHATYHQRRLLRPEHLLQHAVDTRYQCLDPAVKRRAFTSAANRYYILFAANRLHFPIHQWLEVVMVSPHAAVVAVRGLLKRLQGACLDENLV
jgi:hypothetical protein